MKTATKFIIPLLILGAVLVAWLTNFVTPLALTLLVLVSSALLQSLWNSTVSVVIGLRYITYWESFRLLLLCWLVMGSALWAYKLVFGAGAFSR